MVDRSGAVETLHSDFSQKILTQLSINNSTMFGQNVKGKRE